MPFFNCEFPLKVLRNLFRPPPVADPEFTPFDFKALRDEHPEGSQAALDKAFCRRVRRRIQKGSKRGGKRRQIRKAKSSPRGPEHTSPLNGRTFISKDCLSCCFLKGSVFAKKVDWQHSNFPSSENGSFGLGNVFEIASPGCFRHSICSIVRLSSGDRVTLAAR